MSQSNNPENKDDSTNPSLSEFKLPNFLANEPTRKKFCGLYEECLDTLADTFPECQEIKNELETYRKEVKNNEAKEDAFIKEWHNGMLQLYDLADKELPQFWSKPIPFFSRINIHDKVEDPGFKNQKESMEILWEYINGMNRHSRIYCAIPIHMLDRIQTTAMDYVGKVQRGEMKFDLENLNWDEIKDMGQNLMSSINPSDLEEFTGNITGLAQSLQINGIQDIFKFVGDLPGMGDIVNNNQHFTGLLDQIFQNEATQQLIQSVDKLFPSGNNGNPPPPSSSN